MVQKKAGERDNEFLVDSDDSNDEYFKDTKSNYVAQATIFFYRRNLYFVVSVPVMRQSILFALRLHNYLFLLNTIFTFGTKLEVSKCFCRISQ